MAKKANGSKGGDLGFEAELFKAADKIRANMEPSDYKHVVLGLIFLKHISEGFMAKRAELERDYPDGVEDEDEYRADNVFWVPKPARWAHLQANAKQPGIGKLIDEAMLEIEKVNPTLKGVLPKDYARPALNPVMLGELIDLISGIGFKSDEGQSRDVLGRVYEYFLGQFAGTEGKRGGEFYTPRSVVRTMVEMLQPHDGRVYDPCCGSGGMFVQSEKFVENHGGRIGDIAVYGQESNHTTWRLCMMNLAVRGIDADIRWNSDGSFHRNELPDLRADYVLANPPFNVSDSHPVNLCCKAIKSISNIGGSLSEVLPRKADLLCSISTAIPDRLADHIKLAAEFTKRFAEVSQLLAADLFDGFAGSCPDALRDRCHVVVQLVQRGSNRGNRL